MKFKNIILLIILFCALSAGAQRRYWFPRFYNKQNVESDFVRKYSDSISTLRQRITTMPADSFRHSDMYHDLLEDKGYDKTQLSILFLPATFYRDPASHILRLSSTDSSQTAEQQIIDNSLMNIYLNHPELITMTEATIKEVGVSTSTNPSTMSSQPDIVQKVSPAPIEPDFMPVSIVVRKPNFWTFSGDYYLQFLQNYVSGNWYKGGESSYSMVGSVTMQYNYNNKQKVKWDNKLELKLGYQATRSDSIHKFKTSEDLIRYTGKLGLQATKKWYYTLQLIAYTQFARGWKNNDAKVYSDFMSPLNITPSIGMDYAVNFFNKKLTGTANIAPFACNFRYVDRLSLSTRYGLDEGSHTLVDFGSEVTLDLVWKFSDMMQWKSRLYGYTTYKRAELEMENTFTFKFNKYISTNIFVYPRFDDGSTRDDNLGYWQFKEYASIGFSYSF